MFKFLSKLAGNVKKIKCGKVSAVILCAGSSTRFSNGFESKQMALLNGQPVICHTLTQFEECDIISEVVLVVPKGEINDYRKLVCESGFAKVSCIVAGGETRQSSAIRGFKHISEKSKLVAIHDGARCLVTPEIIKRVVLEADEFKAATAACRVTDTVKIADTEGFISKTINREYVWNVQTPQVFETKLYKTCAYNAKEKGLIVTDDCMMVENAGFKVKLVDTGKENIKITVRNDIRLAECILLGREDMQ